jgi:beta-glucosidase
VAGGDDAGRPGGEISVGRINQSVRRILTLKLRLGLFDYPFVDAGAPDAAVNGGRPVTLQAARESITLLRNQDNVVQLASRSRRVVTGVSADSMGGPMQQTCPAPKTPAN